MTIGVQLPEDIAALLDLEGKLTFAGWKADNTKEVFYMDMRYRTSRRVARNAAGVVGYDNAMDALRTWITAGCPEHVAIVTDENFVLTAYPGSAIHNGDIHIVRNSYNGAPDASD